MDDGTAVVDCNHKLSPQPVSPRKASTESKARSSSYKSSAYSPRRGPRPSSSKAIPSLPPPPKPIAEIGAPVRVTGRVVETAKGRYVLVDEIRASSLLPPTHPLIRGAPHTEPHSQRSSQVRAPRRTTSPPIGSPSSTCAARATSRRSSGPSSCPRRRSAPRHRGSRAAQRRTRGKGGLWTCLRRRGGRRA